ncbi:MAG: RDD family protein [Armatimonadetes bacterium]|nr:RDD family protein [Armatimonadota bacterium]MDW8153554.1 RDD family protein [Armatimonadota bacterium]
MVRLLVVLLVVELAVLAWVLTGARARLEARRKAYQDWWVELQADPVRRRLYEAHRRAFWRAGLASLVDVFLCLAGTAALVLLLGPAVGFDIRDGVSDPESFLIVVVWLTCYLVIVFGGFRVYGTTPGLHLLGIAVISPQTGRPADRRQLRPPTRWDYARDRVPEFFFVPKDELRL